MGDHSRQTPENYQVLNYLEGIWMGEGQAQFPTTDSFEYRERLRFERRDENTLAYEQRAEKRPLGQTEFRPSHWESGFLRILPTGDLELINTQSGGRLEALTGTAEFVGNQIKVTFISRLLTNDERMVATGRTFEIEGDTLRYEMAMHMTRVDALMPHLAATLRRVRS